MIFILATKMRCGSRRIIANLKVASCLYSLGEFRCIQINGWVCKWRQLIARHYLMHDIKPAF